MVVSIVVCRQISRDTSLKSNGHMVYTPKLITHNRGKFMSIMVSNMTGYNEKTSVPCVWCLLLNGLTMMLTIEWVYKCMVALLHDS
jgi:hypothetical protein